MRPALKRWGAALAFVFCFTNSFPLVIPGDDQLVWVHRYFGWLTIFFVFPLFVLFMETFKSRWARFFIAMLVGTIATYTPLYWFHYAIVDYGGLTQGHAVTLTTILAFNKGLLFGLFILLRDILDKRGMAAPYFMAGLWVSMELIVSYFPMGGFPIPLVGYSQYSNKLLLQWASVGSVAILSFFIVWTSLLALRYVRERKLDRELKICGGLVALLLIYSGYRLHHTASMKPQGHIRVGVLQPNVDQAIRNLEEMKWQLIVDDVRESMKMLPEQGVDLVVWPEASLPAKFIDNHDWDPKAIWADHFSELPFRDDQIIGLDFYDPKLNKLYNSALFVDDGKVATRYDKIKVTPFGEYIPFWFRWIADSLGFSVFAQNAALGFTHGGRYIVHDYGKAKVAVLICFDGLFPEVSREMVGQGANLLVNMTNDSWFGPSSMPELHLAYYRFRAVEHAMSVVRSANSGISAIIMPDGSVVKRTNIYQRDAFVYDVPIFDEWTIFSVFGHVFPRVLFLYCAFVLYRLYSRDKEAKEAAKQAAKEKAAAEQKAAAEKPERETSE